MKSQTVFIVLVITTVYYSGQLCSAIGVGAQDGQVNSGLLNVLGTKKASFYHSGSATGSNKKVKITHVKLPRKDEYSTGKKRRTRRQVGAYWGSYGQPPLNPTGPPPGAYSPGSSYYPSRNFQRRRMPIKRKSKFKPKLKSAQLSPFLNRTPCPYKLLAEELAEQQNHNDGSHSHENIHHTTTTTTTPAPLTNPPPPVYTQHMAPVVQPQAQTIFYQPVDPLMSPFQQHQLNPIQYESLPQEYLHLNDGLSLQYPFLLDNNGHLLQQQQQQQQQLLPAYSTLSLPSQQQQILYRSDVTTGDIYRRRSTLPLALNQISSPPHSYLQEQLQPVSRIPLGGTVGGLSPLIIDRQQPQQILSQQFSTASFPPSIHQQQQYVLLDNPVQNSHVAPAVILPSGQVVQSQRQISQLQQPSLILLNSQTESAQPPALQFLQQSNQRPTRLNLPSSNLPILSDFHNILNAESRIPYQNNRPKTPQSPIFLQPPSLMEEDDEEEENLERVIYQSNKRSKRPEVLREKERKRYIVIPKKELEKLKNKKQNIPQSQHQPKVYVQKNFPPPPEVVHIPSYPDNEEDEYEHEDDSGNDKDTLYNFNGSLAFSGSPSQQQQQVEDLKPAQGTHNDGKESGGDLNSIPKTSNNFSDNNDGSSK